MMAATADKSAGARTGLGRKIATVLTWATLLFLIPLAPVLGSVASIIASLLTLLMAPVAVIRNGWRRIGSQPAMLVFVLVFVALGLSFAVTARTPDDPVYVINFLSLPLAAVLYPALRQRPEQPDPRVVLAWLCLAACVVAALVAVNDIFIRDIGRVRGFNMGPHVVARTALVFAFVALALVMSSASRWRFVTYAGLPLALLVIYLSGTRGALVAFVPMMVVFAGFLFARREDRPQVWIMAGLTIVASVALLTLSDRLGALVQLAMDLLSEGTTEARTASVRFQMIAAAWELFQQAPWLGYGWANFTEAAYPLISEAIKGGPNDRWFQFHNDLANFAVAAGMVGVVSWLALLAAPIVGALTTPRDRLFRARLYICVQLSISYFVFGLTDFTFGYDLPTTLYVFLTAIALGALRDHVPSPQEAAPALRRTA